MSQSSSNLALKASLEYELTNNDPPPEVRQYLEQRIQDLVGDGGETVTRYDNPSMRLVS